MLLADQMMETTPPGESWDLGFWSQCHLLIKGWRDPDQKADTPKGGETLMKKMEATKGQRHPDQKVETPKHRCLKSVSLADQKVETPWWKDGENQSQNTLIKKMETPRCRILKSLSLADQNIGFCGDTSWWKDGGNPKWDTLIKRWRTQT